MIQTQGKIQAMVLSEQKGAGLEMKYSLSSRVSTIFNYLLEGLAKLQGVSKNLQESGGRTQNPFLVTFTRCVGC